MKRRISAMEARKRLGDLLESVYHRGDEVIIERAGKPMAVVIPAARYAAMERQREEFWKMVEATWEKNKDVPPEEIHADVEAAIREVREAKRRTRRSA
jgi:prevent-host-death family protein